MIFWKLISFLFLLLVLSGSSCNIGKFEREKQVIELLKNEKNIDVKLEESLQVIVLQDNICGACTKNVLDFIFNLNLKNSIIVLSDDNKRILDKFKDKIGDQKMIIDSTRIIDRHGLRYARDLFISFKNGKLNYWSFIEDENFDEITRKMR